MYKKMTKAHPPAFTPFSVVIFLAASALLGLTFGLLPFYFSQQHKTVNNLTLQEKPLTGSQIMRGAYNNTGSKDAGKDPDWVDGRYMGKSARSFQPTEAEVQEHREDMERRKQRGIER